jgi:hypothetical protein
MNITGVKHNSKGELISYKLDNGSVIGKDEGITLAKQGKIQGITVGVSKSGEEYLRSMPDGREANNLDNMPEINQGE